MKSLGSIVAVGMRTPMGLGAIETSFLLRTGVPSLAAAPLADADGEHVTMAFDRTLDPYLTGEQRAARLGAAALAEIVSKIGPTAARSLRTRVALAFPEARPGIAASATGVTLASAFRDALRETFGTPEVDVANRGAAGLAYVLPQALAALAKGEVDAVLAGGVDSDYDPMIIASLTAQGRLFTKENTDAIVPGEAGAFVLITRDDTAQKLGCRPLARLHAVATDSGGVERGDSGRAFDATAIAHIIQESTKELPTELRVGWAVTDTTFEHSRVRELYAALTRTHKRFGPPLVIDSPAQRLGHLGAAALGLELGFMTVALQRGFAPCPLGLALSASDAGERSAILIGSA